MKRWLFVAALACFVFAMFSISSAQETGDGFIKGKIAVKDGKTISGWRIRFFDVKAGPTPFTTEYQRVPDFMIRSEDDGSFSAKLPEGMYYVTALKKSPEKKQPEKKRPGPEEGDLIYPPMDSREPKPYIVKAGETTDIGVISAAVPFKKEWAVKIKTGIEGTVVDGQGEPVEGVLVFATTVPGAKIPRYSSGYTGKDGKYVLGLPEGGQYYLRVRDRQLSPVTVKTGEITRGIDITLTLRLGDQEPE